MHSRAANLLDVAEVLNGGNVRGWILRAHLLWVLEYGSPDDERALVHPRLEGFEPDAWYPFASLIALDRAIAERFATGVDHAAVFHDLGRFSARINLSMRFAQGSDDDHHRFFDETARVHGELYDFGQAAYLRLGKTTGIMAFTECRSFSPVACASAIGWYEQCLLLHGAIRASVVEQRCRCRGDRACLLDMKWR